MTEQKGDLNQEVRKLYITKTWVTIIFVYYVSLFSIALYFTICTLLEPNLDQNILKYALVGSISISLCASSIYYIRKLYKLCFSFSTEQEEHDQLQLKILGTIFYFLTRPIFAVLFSVLVVIGSTSGMFAAVESASLNTGFVYITMFFSFYVGFSSGEFIKKLEREGTNKIDQLVG